MFIIFYLIILKDTERVKTEKPYIEIPGLVPDNFPTPVSSTNDCRGDGAIRCSDGSHVICSTQICDGINHCLNGEDEKNCSHSMIFYFYFIFST